MKKKIIITVLGIFLSTILNGCVSASHSVSEITDADAISQSLTNTNASMQTGPLTLTVIGENKLLVTLTDDRTNGFLDFDESSTSQRTFNVNFFAKNQQKLSISMTPYSWDLSGSENISKGGAFPISMSAGRRIPIKLREIHFFLKSTRQVLQIVFVNVTTIHCTILIKTISKRCWREDPCLIL